MSTTLFIPLAREFRLLPVQLELCRRFIAGLDRVLIVETAPGPSWIRSGGPWRLRREMAAALEVDLIEGPDVAGLIPPHRIGKIFAWLRLAIAAACDDEHNALVLSGDVLPLRHLDVAEMCSGQPAATRDPWTCCTWFCGQSRKLPDLDEPGWRLHAAYRMQPEDANLPGLAAAGYAASMGFEWLEPGFLHADKLVTRGEFAEDKIPVLEKLLGVKLPSHEIMREEL